MLKDEDLLRRIKKTETFVEHHTMWRTSKGRTSYITLRYIECQNEITLQTWYVRSELLSENRHTRPSAT
jgi:hypothetical protein